MTVKEEIKDNIEEKVVDDKKESTKKTSSKKSTTSSTKTVSKKEFDDLKKDFSKFTQSVDDEILSHSATLEKLNDNLNILIKSLNSLSKRFDDLEKKTNEVDLREENMALMDLLNKRVVDCEEDLGDLIDKVDVLFVGDSNEDLQSRLKKVEKVVFGRLHTKNA
jgi:chromosome segregation ATPase